MHPGKESMSFFRVLVVLLSLLGSCPSIAETITLGAEDAWYPYSGIIKGEARGFTVDIVRAAFAAVNIDARFEPLPYARCTKLVKDGSLLGCFNTARSSMVEGDFLWHKRAMFTSRSTIYARSDYPQRNIDVAALEGKRVAVSHTYEYGDAFDSNQKVIRDNSPNDLSGFRKLAAGRTDFALAYEKVANLLIKEHPAEFEGKLVAVGVIEELKLYTAFSKTFPNSGRYIELLDRGFEIIHKNGRFLEIEKQWK